MIARPGQLAAPGATDGLGQQLVRPLGGPLVGQVQGDVGRNDADERHLGDVQALGHQARADQHVQPALGERVQDPLDGALALGDVAVETADPEMREGGPDLLLHALGAAAQIADPRRAAGRAARRQRASPSRSGGSAASPRPGGRRGCARIRGSAGRGRSRGRPRPRRCRGG